MDEQAKQAEQGAATNDPSAVTPSHAIVGNVGKDASDGIEEPGRDPKRKQRPKFFESPQRIGADRVVELFLTCGIVYFAGMQYVITRSNSDISTRQLGQIILAAGDLDKAAKSFANSANAINGRIGDAVIQLQDQGTKLEAARKTSQQDSENALDQTRIQSQLDQRPWVSMTGIQKIPAADDPMGHYRARTVLTNSGKTPALNVRSIIGSYLIHGQIIPDEVDGDWMKAMVEGVQAGSIRAESRLEDSTRNGYAPSFARLGVIAPQQISSIGSNAGASFLVGSGITIIVYGKVLYDDGFGKTMHITWYCQYTWHGDKPDPDWVICPVFNDMK
jgi:hypothetical protein